MGFHKNIDIAIVTEEPFPIGMAASNRITSYAIVLAKTKIIKVFITKPTENEKQQYNFESTGIYYGVEYEYTSGSVIWPKEKSKALKFYLRLKGYLTLIKKLYVQKPQTVVLYTSNFSTRIVIYLMKIILNFRFIIEENEYPKIINQTKNKMFRYINLSMYKKCDGMLVMTDELAQYYKSINAKDVFVLPMTVNISLFENIDIKVSESNYFIYVGGGGGFKRDGVFDVVKGFTLFRKKYPEYKLLIIGPYNSGYDSIKAIVNWIDENQLGENIILTGSKPTNIIPSYLLKATGIVMAPPKNFESGGFPTKLGEFLMSGVPVITTAVSDIPKYLNNDNSFIVKTNSPQDIALAMAHIVEDYLLAKKIGLRGKELAQIHFNAETYLDNLLTFLKIGVKVQ